MFDEASSLIVDPAEEKLRDEFKETKSLHLPIQAILRIEEVEKRGTAAIRDASNGAVFREHVREATGHDLRILLCEVDEQHPFVQHELLTPVIGLVRARDTADAIAMALRVEHGFHHTATMQSTNVDHMAAMARVCNCSIFVKNDASYAGLGLGGEGYTSFTIASPTGEGLTTAVHFTRERRCTLKEAFRFV